MFFDNLKKPQCEEREIDMSGNQEPLNLMLPGNPRYQPKQLVPIFGYDYLYKGVDESGSSHLIYLIHTALENH